MSRKKKIAIAVAALAGIGAVVAIAAPGPRNWHGHGGAYGFDNAQGYGWGKGHGGRGHGGDMSGMGGMGLGMGPGLGDGDGMGRGRWHRSGMTKDDYEGRVRERFARIDRNSDGVIDRAEIEAMTAERRGGRFAGRDGAQGGPGQRLLQRFDLDRDGKVTRDEFLKRVSARFAEADLDNDGRITDADLPPMMRGRGMVARLAEGGGRGPLRFLQGVEVKDGAITREAYVAHATKEFDRMDANKDGVVDTADVEALRKEMTDYRVRRFVHMFGGDAAGQVTRDQFYAKARERFAEMDHDGDGRIGHGGMRERMQRWMGGDRGPGGPGGPGGPVGPGATPPKQ